MLKGLNSCCGGKTRSLEFRKFYAFTLAEVLITLVIIGVIAAITVPIIWGEYQKQITVERLKKAYSTLAQTTARAIADNGSIEGWEMGEENNPDDAISFFNTYIAPYISMMKPPVKRSDGNWNDVQYFLNGEKNNYGNSYARTYLADGTSLTFDIHNGNRLVIWIDINGDNKPNKIGRDIFLLNYYIDSGHFTPQETPWTREKLLSSASYACNKNQKGSFCLALIMKDGWQIKKDYPW